MCWITVSGGSVVRGEESVVGQSHDKPGSRGKRQTAVSCVLSFSILHLDHGHLGHGQRPLAFTLDGSCTSMNSLGEHPNSCHCTLLVSPVGGGGGLNLVHYED